MPTYTLTYAAKSKYQAVITANSPKEAVEIFETDHDFGYDYEYDFSVDYNSVDIIETKEN